MAPDKRDCKQRHQVHNTRWLSDMGVFKVETSNFQVAKESFNGPPLLIFFQCLFGAFISYDNKILFGFDLHSKNMKRDPTKRPLSVDDLGLPVFQTLEKFFSLAPVSLLRGDVDIFKATDNILDFITV